MHLSRDEAISILDAWRNQGIALRIYFSRAGANREFHASIRAITASAIELDAGPETLHVDLEGVEFNGDDNAVSSDYKAYLVCELRNGDRCYFYMPRIQR